MGRPWFALYALDLWGDADVAMLTDFQFRMLVMVWCRCCMDGGVPSDPEQFARIMKCRRNVAQLTLQWLPKFLKNDPSNEGRLISERMEREASKYNAIVERNKTNGEKGGRPKKPSGFSLGFGLGNPKETEPQPQPQEDIIPTPLGQGEVKRSKRPSWQIALASEVVKATHEIRAIWPSPQQDHYQPDAKTLVPGVSASELATRLSEINGQGADLGICVEIAKRAVSEWQAGKWIKAPQHFFGKSKDAPYKSYYQAHVTNQQMKALRAVS